MRVEGPLTRLVRCVQLLLVILLHGVSGQGKPHYGHFTFEIKTSCIISLKFATNAAILILIIPFFLLSVLTSIMMILNRAIGFYDEYGVR